MAQTAEERKQTIAKARKMHHLNQTTEKKRIDAYVLEETKHGLKEIKALNANVKNEGQAIDLAVKLALEWLKTNSL